MAEVTMDVKDCGPDEASRAVVRIHVGVLALICAVIGGIGLFTLTVLLILQRGPQAGLHLQLLRYFFAGYSVTWPGSVVGFCYGTLLGGGVGWAIGKIYNGVVNLRGHESPVPPQAKPTHPHRVLGTL